MKEILLTLIKYWGYAIIAIMLTAFVYYLYQIISHMIKFKISTKDLLNYLKLSESEAIYNGLLVNVTFGIKFNNEDRVPLFNWAKAFIFPNKFDSFQIKDKILNKLEKKFKFLIKEIDLKIDEVKIIKKISDASDEIIYENEESLIAFIEENISNILEGAKRLKNITNKYNKIINSIIYDLNVLINEARKEELKWYVKYELLKEGDIFANLEEITEIEGFVKAIENYKQKLEDHKAKLIKRNEIDN